MSTTITGSIKTIATGLPGSNSFVRFILRGTGGNQPHVTGTAAVAPLLGGNGLFYSDLAADANGAVSGTIYSTRDATGLLGGEIELGGSLTSAYFDMVVYAGGLAGPPVSIHTKNTATIDISSPPAISLPVVVTAPTGDTTYLRTDAANSPVTGLTTFSAGLVSKKLNNIRFADQFSGADIGAKINAAYADLTSSGGVIYLAAGAYSFSTAISFSTADKPAVLIGAPGGGTTLTWTSNSGTAFTYNVSSNHEYGGCLRDIALVGNGSGTTAVGVLLGGTNGAEGVLLENVKVSAFGTGETFGNNAWAITHVGCSFILNGQQVLIPSGLSNAGERFSYFGCTFANSSSYQANGFQCQLAVNDLTLVGCNFDNVQFAASTGQCHLTSCYWENPSQATTTPFISNTGANISIISPDCFASVSGAGSVPNGFINASSGTTGLLFGSFFSNTTMAWSIVLSGTANFFEYGTKLSNTTGFVSNSSSGSVGQLNNIWGSNQIVGLLNITDSLALLSGKVVKWNGDVGLSRDGSVAKRIDVGNGTAGDVSGSIAAAGLVVNGGTLLSRYARYTPTLSPSAVSANTTAEQTFTTVLTSGDFVVGVSKPTAQAGLGIVGWRANGTSLLITFANNTASPITPTASEVYQVIAVQ